MSGCTNIQDGEYLGGFLHVEGFSEPNEKSEPQPDSQKKESVTQTNNVEEPSEPDLSAKANAQGVCWIGCQSKEPTPMDEIEFSVDGVDIDTVYARIKREFDFKTRSERIEENPSVEGWLENTLDFRYQATPSVNYLMRGYKDHKYMAEESPNTIQVEIFVEIVDYH